MRPAPPPRPRDPPAIVALKPLIAVVALGLTALAALSELHVDLGALMREPALSTFSLVVLAVVALRVALWIGYRPAPSRPAGDPALPTLTVVVPAFNEGPGVVDTVESLLASDYPHDRLRVIVVDDGSTDDTGVALDQAHARLVARGETRFEVVHLPANAGKRHALHAGFSRAVSELVATIDSDSVARPDTLRALVAPFADPRVAGVAGRVMVLNRFANLLTRMLHVRYLLGFDFVRAYQSRLGTVWCCPGALQCYRLAVIRPHLMRWRDQRFLGARCTNGDDHALTNLVLSLGHDTRYQQSAEVYTIVPETYRRLCKMYIRWGRSTTREGLRALAFTPRRAVSRGLLAGPLIALDALSQPLAIALRLVSIAGGAWLLLASPVWLFRTVLVSTLFALPYAFVYLRSERSTDVLFGVLYGWYALFGLFWVQPFATLTVRRNGWLTRG